MTNRFTFWVGTEGVMAPKLRLAIYSAIAACLALLQALGYLTAEQGDSLLTVANSILQLAAAIMLIVATRRIDYDSWAELRAALYVSASALLASAGLWGILAPDLLPPVLQVVDSMLSLAGVAILGVAGAKVPAGEYVPERIADDA